MASITTEKTGTESRDTMLDSLDTTLTGLSACLRPLASLRLTVILFALSILIVLVGTLAQVSMDMWEVMDRYFLCWFAWIEFQVFFPRSWFPNLQNVPFGFPFPGGATIGALLVLNLVAAHVVRFKVQAKGRRLYVGLGVLAVGMVLTSLVILSGHNMTGLQGAAPVSWTTLWFLIKLGVAGTGLAALVGAITLPLADSRRRIEQYGLAAVACILLAIAAWLFLAGEGAYLGDAGMRILWQLIQSGAAGLVLLAGAVLLFKKRGGIVVIHMGVALLMFGQFWVAKYDVEEQMTIDEGATVSFAHDIRSTELAVIDSSDPTKDVVVVVPQSLLLQSVGRSKGTIDGLGYVRRGLRDWFSNTPYVDEEGVIHHDDLPFDLQVLVYYKNANLDSVKELESDKQNEDSTDAESGDESADAESSVANLATVGTGLIYVAKPARAASGTGGSEVDLAAAYVKVLSKENGDELGTYLLSQIASAQEVAEEVAVGDRTYEVSLRFERSYKPYSVTLLDVRKDDYLGTSTPRNYSSDVQLVDLERGTDRNIRIWMNNPLRYAGETIYQTGYIGPPQTRKETTTLSVVTNSGWMIPYVACMVVMVGLLAHFLSVLVRFLSRRERAALPVSQPVEDSDSRSTSKSGRRNPYQAGQAAEVEEGQRKGPAWLSIAIPVAVVGLFAILFLRTANRPQPDPAEFNLQAVGELPVIADGRVKPMDTLARNTLRVISNRESFKGRIEGAELDEKWPKIVAELHKKWPAVDAAELKALDGDLDAAIAMIAGNPKAGTEHYVVDEYVDKLATTRYPAIRWFMDVIARPSVAEKHKVFRIDNLEVLDMLELDRRKSHCYSVEEIRGGVVEFEKQVDAARGADVQSLSTFQRKLIELDQRIRSYTRIGAAFQPPMLPPLPTPEEFEKDRATATRKITEFRQAYFGFVRSIEAIHPPLAVPNEKGSTIGDDPSDEDADKWQSYATAWATALINVRMLGEDPPPSLDHLNKIVVTYGQREPVKFNDEVDRYKRHLRRDGPPQLKSKYASGKLTATGLMTTFVEKRFDTFYGFEAYFNYVSPFFFCWWPYLFAFVLTATSWLVWPKSLNRAAFWLIIFTLVIHSLALVARIYISGRPPVTNLYSSAVFIGWGAVVFGLVLEYLYRNGVGNIVAATIGFATMVIAHNLAGDGDTFTVLQAVLDTQFWLATHVVCITFGYATTFLAGAIGLIFVLRGVFSSGLSAVARKDYARMIYGVICFAMFFSFVGTVLGGLWADDSWGRFWGWDPKENGALLIVLWNALVLHARWGGIVKERGMAVLALGGNVVTAWSWFGVNELGVGLHSYGFTEGVLPTLAAFVGSQLVVAAIGCLPLTMWLSYRADQTPAEALA